MRKWLTPTARLTLMLTWLACAIGVLNVCGSAGPRSLAIPSEGPDASRVALMVVVTLAFALLAAARLACTGPSVPVAPAMLSVRQGWWGNDHNDDPMTARLKKREITRSWREACEPTALAHWVPAPAGTWRAVPWIEQIILGNPTSIVIRLRPGQLPSDVEARAERIAYAMEACSLRVSETAVPMRLRVEFLDRPAERVESDVRRLPARPPLASIQPSARPNTDEAA